MTLIYYILISKYDTIIRNTAVGISFVQMMETCYIKIIIITHTI